ncbi:MAG: class I SAM-dependent methyltransferase [Clostridia bacterium]|jgi:ubiquinone/menaquinone biosynthesis C-methylase UbiE|nr:class I SAM-dependent methyltransferase [Lachnospiraceae bacterium]NCB99717.1 class I SAM-dependent methyltransferase [Clostridia bacterium]NCD01711.1 class I SAM-dependent methyltransferase [Clostridia bacterium]
MNKKEITAESKLSISIENTKKGFEESFEIENFYNKQTQDQAHLEQILHCLKINDGMRILDLGTGTGYLAFPIAAQYPKSEVIGLDIVEQALEKNRKRAVADGMNNIQFVSYDGLTFPFTDQSFDMVITRYALHHFPAIKDTFWEINRVLKPKGTFFLTDPAPNENDSERFVDAYMQMKKDGHIKFYTKKEWQEIGKMAGFERTDCFETRICFPRKKQDSLEFNDILTRFDEQVIKGYGLEITDEEIWITERVNNLLFQKV